MSDRIQVFDNQPIRTAWDEEKEEWFFSIVDVIGVLTEQPDTDGARNYWKVLKNRLNKEGSQLVTNCNQLKLRSQDGKNRLTDVASTEQLLRLIQSIPSKKAEPFKLWLAQVGRERIEETIDPEMTIDRALETYARLGYPVEWINQSLQAIQVRKELTDHMLLPPFLLIPFALFIKLLVPFFLIGFLAIEQYTAVYKSQASRRKVICFSFSSFQ